MKANKTPKQTTVREFPPVGGKYRVRILEDADTRTKCLDIREYVVSPNVFEGFTRRGVRLCDRAQVELLRDALSEVLRDMLL
jgi:hypothetical protein